ncbi:MAG: molybdopterin-containing oxidoreductase family protein [Halodesulfurarchaeum sp.]
MSDASGSGDDFGLTRRTLLKAGGAGAGAAALGGCLSAADAPEEASGEATTAHGNCWQCHKYCGMEVTLNGDGKAEEVHGVDGHPRGSAGEGTKGTLCPKGLSQLEKAYSPRRIKQPHVRKDGELKKVGWDEAFEYTAEMMESFDQDYGANKMVRLHGFATAAKHEACLPSSNPFKYVFGNLYGSSESVPHPVPTCFGSSSQTYTLAGLGGNMRWPDFPNTKYLLVWGRNPLETFAGQWEAKQLLEAKERGATIVTIDPQYTETAKKSDKWLPIKPRTDGALALAMGHVIVNEGLYDEDFVDNHTHGFETYREAVADKTPEWAAEKTGLDAEDIRDIAVGFAEAAPAAAMQSWTGLGQSPDLQKAAQNQVSLLGLVGAIDRPGGQKLWSCAPTKDPFEDVEGLPNNAEGKENPMKEYLPMAYSSTQNAIPTAIKNGDVKGLTLYYRNPVKDGAAEEWLEALDELEMFITIDSFWSSVSRKADVVLPEASQLEKPMYGHGGYGAYNTKTWVTGSKAAIDPQFDTKSGWEILKGIAEALGYGEYFPWEDKEEYIDEQLSPVDMTLDELDEKNYELIDSYGYEKWKDGGFANDTETFWFDFDKKFDELYKGLSEQYDFEFDTGPQWVPPGTIGDELTDEYPLELIDHRTVYFSHGGDQALDKPLEQFAESMDKEHEDYRGNYLHINPKDASSRGISDGDMVSVEGENGEVSLMAHVTEGIVPGTVSMAYGFGAASIQPDEEGANSMMLNTPDDVDPINGQIDRHLAVQVAPAGGEH